MRYTIKYYSVNGLLHYCDCDNETVADRELHYLLDEGYEVVWHDHETGKVETYKAAE